jgi:8-oxo-dGTP pyrophosphatase MutT (NUDIX family)
LVAPDPDAVLLIRRAERAGDPWSGHFGLPGGRRDPEDADLGETARRETREEVGLDLDPAAQLGILDDVWPRSATPAPIIVRPFVYSLDQRPTLQTSAEVAEAFWVPLAVLADPANYREARIRLQGREQDFPGYHLPQGLVWGLTERILTGLLELR